MGIKVLLMVTWRGENFYIRTNLSYKNFLDAMRLARTEPNPPSKENEMSKNAVFPQEHSSNPVKSVKETAEVIRDDEGREAMIFTTVSGRGIATHSIPCEEYDGFVAALEHFVENPPEDEPEANTAGERVMQSFKLVVPTDEDGDPTGEAPYYQYKLTTGRGSKPCRIPAAQFAEVVSLLRSAEDALPALIERLHTREAAEARAKGADAGEGDNAGDGDGGEE